MSEVLITEKGKHHIHLQAEQEEDLGNYKLVFLMSVHGKVIEQIKKQITVHKLKEVVDPLTGMAVIHRNLDRMEKYTDGNFMKFKEGNAKSGTLGGIIPCNRTGWGLTGRKRACREEAGGPDGQVEQKSAVCPYGNEGKPYTCLH